MVLGLVLLFVMLAAYGVQAEEAQETDAQEYKIGVVVYNPDAQEMRMFMDYYQDYLEEGFSVKFFFSGPTYTAGEENAFIKEAKEAGVQGIISFLGADVQSTVSVCEENGLYYILGSNSISDEDFDAVKDNPWFLGVIGPEQEAVYEAGRDMAEFFLEKEARSILIMTGGASKGNSLHAARTEGMLDVFAEQAGLVLGEASEEIAQSEEIRTLTNEDGSVSVTLCPDYTEGGNGLENLEQAFSEREYDTLMSAFHTSTYLDKIYEKEKAQGSNIMVGAIDSFTEANFEAYKTKDPFGNSPLDYVQGKYGALAGAAFAILYNAMSGHPEANTPDGEAVRLYQGFWRATTREEFIELYGYATGIYENAYSCDDLMSIIKVFNDDADPEAVRELTESWNVEAVKDRILNG